MASGQGGWTDGWMWGVAHGSGYIAGDATADTQRGTANVCLVARTRRHGARDMELAGLGDKTGQPWP